MFFLINVRNQREFHEIQEKLFTYLIMILDKLLKKIDL